MKILSRIFAAVMAVIWFSALARADVWHMPTPYPITSFHTKNLELFAEDVKKETEGQLEIKIHPAGSLIKHEDIMRSVRGGQVPIGEFLLSRLSNDNAIFEVDSLPFLASNYEDSLVLWEVSRPYMQEVFDKDGLLILFSVPWPPQALYTKRPVTKLDDLSGVKIRAYNKTQERLAQLAGAVPAQIEVPEIPQAFSSGRVQAMITSPSTAASAQAWDFVSHSYDTQAWLPKNVVVVNKRALMRLAPAVRTAVLDAAARAEARGWEMSKAETNAQIAVLKQHGLNAEKPTPELSEGLHRIGDVVAEEWKKQAGRTGEAILSKFRRKQMAAH
jgi:TRAP-type C4-dicarboxylate transport system substrate-binding protein